jgi:general secretion pathway protein C
VAYDQILRKNFWAVLLALVGTAAFLNAEALTQLVAASLTPEAGDIALEANARPLPPSRSAKPFHATSAGAILARNPFDSVTGPLIAKPVDLPSTSADGRGEALTGNPFDAPPCEAVQVLALAASDDPNWSFAALKVGTSRETILRRRGGPVGTKTVKFVGWDRVWLEGGSVLCQADMFAKHQASGTPPAQRPIATPAPSPRGSLDPAITRGIQKVSATERNIDRGVVDKILENQADLMRQARIVPERENGRMVGIRLFGVRPDTLLGVLGMENGDRLQTINGFDMTSPEKALEAYARLRTADHLTVQVNRRGVNTNLDYNIR